MSEATQVFKVTPVYMYVAVVHLFYVPLYFETKTFSFSLCSCTYHFNLSTSLCKSLRSIPSPMDTSTTRDDHIFY